MSDHRIHVSEGRAVGLAALWFGFLGGAVAWTAQLLGSYFVVTLGCTTRTGLTLIIHLISLLALIVTALALLVSWRTWQQTGTDEAYGARTVVQRGGFMGLFGLFANALFAILILFTAVTAFALPQCS
jgi:hypothetical protein